MAIKNPEMDEIRQKVKDLERECAALKLENDRYQQIIGGANDPHNADKEIKEKDFGLRLILDSSPFGVSIISPDNPDKRLFVNKRMAELFGYPTVEDMLPFSATESYVNPVDIENLRRSNREGDFQTEAVVERYRQDSTRWWCEINRRQARFEGDDVIIAWHNDVTDRKQAEEISIEKTATLQAVFDNSPLNMNLKDITGRYQLINKQYAEWYGLTPEDIVGKKASEFFYDPPMADSLDQIESYVLETGEPNQYEVKIKGMDGKWYDRQVIKFPVKTEDGKINSIGTVAIDITERKQNEESLQTALIAAEQANGAKSEFLATMSHEFRTPLNAILGFSEMIRALNAAPLRTDKIQEYANDIFTSGQHMLGLVNDILDMAAIEAGKRNLSKEAFSVDELITKCFAIVAHAANERRINLSTDIPDDLPALVADLSSVRQIVLNLLSNAIKFTNENGLITISALLTNEDITIKISDTGIGIPHDKLADITKPFTQVNVNSSIAHTGTGLGLSIVTALVELHDGEMVIESEINKGTSVSVTLPCDG